MSILTTILGTVIKPVTELVDSLHTSEEEKLTARAALLKIQSDAAAKVLEYEVTMAKELGATVRAEVQGKSPLQRLWRPITMLVFVFIIFNNFVLVPYVAAFGATVPTLEIPPGMWALLNIGIGGYIASRGVEKVVGMRRNGA
jgi:hypothetical protein